MNTYNKAIYSIREYESFVRGNSVQGYKALPEKAFDALESLILSENKSGETEAIQLLSISARKGVGKIITARNYVGVIKMTDGTLIQILPKIAGAYTQEETLQIFIDMLKALKNAPFKEFKNANLKASKFNLLEIFITMFLEETALITKRGLKAGYTPIEANEHFFKGKLMTAQNIKHNLVNEERFFVRYDDFNLNRPENRIIKETLRFLLKCTTDFNNRKAIIQLLSFFDGVEFPKSIDADFSKCFITRHLVHYEKVLAWCKIFLKGNSFTAFSGNHISIALLFPMEKIFESYVAAKFRKHINGLAKIRAQVKGRYLFESPSPAFELRPDIVLEGSGCAIVLDTKWKILSSKIKNCGISQADMYQMYAYGKKFGAEQVILLYPLSEDISTPLPRYTSADNVTVKVQFIDLKNIDACVKGIIAQLFKF